MKTALHHFLHQSTKSKDDTDLGELVFLVFGLVHEDLHLHLQPQPPAGNLRSRSTTYQVLLSVAADEAATPAASAEDCIAVDLGIGTSMQLQRNFNTCRQRPSRITSMMLLSLMTCRVNGPCDSEPVRMLPSHELHNDS